MRIDLHTHSNISDGTDSPTALVRKAHLVGLQVVSLTDHDTFDGLNEAEEAGRRFGIAIFPGVEISTHIGQTEVHLLGYGADPWAQPLRSELARLRISRVERLPKMLAKLHDLGMDLSEEDVAEQAGRASSLGRPHIADALVAKGYVASRDEAFEKYLDNNGPAYVPRETLELSRAIDLVHGAHGVNVIAHPWIRGNKETLTPELIASLAKDHGLEGIEVDHPSQDQETRMLLFELGARLGLIRTGSSDYHGSGKVGHDLGCESTRSTALRELVIRIKARGGSIGGVESLMNRL